MDYLNDGLLPAGYSVVLVTAVPNPAGRLRSPGPIRKYLNFFRQKRRIPSVTAKSRWSAIRPGSDAAKRAAVIHDWHK